MKAKVTIQVEIDTANYQGYPDSDEGVKNVAEDVMIGVVTLKEVPVITVDAPLSPNPS